MDTSGLFWHLVFLAFGGFPLFCWVSKPLTCATCADRARVGSMATQIVTTMNANPTLAPQVPESLVKTEHPTPPADAAAAPPPAAALVAHGTKSEREVELERRLEHTEREKIDRERRVSELERDVEELKQIPGLPVLVAKKPKRKFFTSFSNVLGREA